MNDRTTVFNVSVSVFVPPHPPPSDAAGYNRVYLRAGLDHLSGHGGKHLPELPREQNPPPADDAAAFRTLATLDFIASVAICWS